MRALSRALSAFLVLAVMVAFALYVRPYLKKRVARLEEYIPQILAIELTQYMGRGVRVQQIHWQGSYRKRHEIEFDGLTLERQPGEVGPSLASIDRAIVHYNPALLTLHFFHPLDAIDSLDVYHPVIFVLHERSGEWNVQHILKPSAKKKQARLPLTTTIHIHDGDVTYLDLKTPHGPPQGFGARVINLNGTALLQQDGPVRFQMDGVGVPLPGSPYPMTGHDHVSGVANVGGGGLALQLTTDRADLAPVMGAYFSLKFASIHSGLGAGTISLQRQDAQGGAKAPFQYSIQARFSHLSASVTRLSQDVTNASGTLAMADQTIQFHIDQGFYGPARISGSGELLGFHQPFIDGSFAVSGLTHGVLAPLVKPSLLDQAQLGGPFSADLHVTGPVDLPDVQGTIHIPQAFFRGSQLTGSNVAFNYSNRRLDLTGAAFHIGGGLAAVSGVVAIGGSGGSGAAYHLTGYIRGAEAAALPLPPSIRAESPSGVITANIDVTGVASTFGVTGDFSLLRPALSVKGTAFRAVRASGNLHMLYHASGESTFGARISMDRLQVRMKGKNYAAASASGIVNAQMGRSGLQGLTTQGLMTGLSGGNLNIQSAAWTLRPGAGGNDQANLLITDPRGEVRLSGDVAHNLSAFHLAVLARNLDLDDLRVLAPSSPPIDGIAFLRGTLSGSPTNPAFTGSTQILQPTFGSVSFERMHGGLSVTRNAVRFSQMTVHWGPGEVTLNGSLSLSDFKPQSFHLAAAASGISLSQLAALLHRPIDVSGSANARVVITGAFAHPVITGGITLHDATVQQYALTTATTTFSYAPDLAALRLAGAGSRSSSRKTSLNLTGRTAQSTAEQTSLQVAALLKGLDLRTLDVRSPMANLHAVGAPIGPDGVIHIDAAISNISLGTLRLPPQVLLQETMGAQIAVRGSVRQPEIILSLGRGDSTVPLTGSIQPVSLQLDGQPFALSAENIILEPDLAALTSHTPGVSMIRRLRVGSLSLTGHGQEITLAGEVLPRMDATAVASGFKLSTLAGMLQQPLPAGLSGTLRRARLSVQGPLPPVTSTLTAEMAQPGFANRTMRSLSGSLAVTLADIEMVPPVARPVRTGPTAPGTEIPAPRPPGAIRVQSETPVTVSAATSSDTPGTAAAPPSPPPTPIQFAIGQIDATFAGPRVTIHDLHFYQFAPPDPRAPGLNLETLNPPGGPAPYFEIGGSLAITAEAPLIPVSIFSPWVPIARNVSGDIQVAVRASGQTSSPVIEVSVDEAVTPAPAPLTVTLPNGKTKKVRKKKGPAAPPTAPSGATPLVPTPSGLAPAAPPGPTPLVVDGIELQRASIVATVQEGAVQLNQMIVAARGHAVEASGQIPFTYHAAAGESHFPSDRPLSLQVGLEPDTLAILHDLAPAMVTSASGALSATLSVAGTMRAYTIHGAITAGAVGAPGKIFLNHFDQPIQNLLIALSFDGQRITVNRFSGGADKGTFQLTGFAELPSTASPDGAIQMTLKTSGLHLTDHGLFADTVLRSRIASEAQRRSYYEQVVGFLESQFKLSGPLMRPLIAGSATLHDASIRATMLPGNQNPPPTTRTFDPTFALRFVVGQKVTVAMSNVLQVKPTGSFTLTDRLSHPVLNGHLDTGRGGGYVNYYVGFWRLENSATDIHYEPPTDPTASGLDIYLHAVLTTQITESTPSTSSVSFFGPSGQSLQVTMEVDGRPFVPNGFHILSLTSDPPRPRSELEQLILHEQALQSILAGSTQSAIPGLFNEVVRQSLTGSLLAPWEMQIASSLGLEELNVSYDFGGPLFVEVSRHLFGGVSARLRQAITGGSSEYQYYFDYRLKGSMTLSFGLLQRPTYQEESLTLQTFLRF